MVSQADGTTDFAYDGFGQLTGATYSGLKAASLIASEDEAFCRGWLCRKKPEVQRSSAMTMKPLLLTHPDNLKEIVWATLEIDTLLIQETGL